MTERVTKLMKNFDEVSTVLTRIITAEGLCVYCRARQPDSKNKATQTGAEDGHGSLSWTACFDDECQTHRSEKDGAGWYPKGNIRGTNSWVGSPKGKAPMKKGVPTPTRGQGRSTSPENDSYTEDDHHFYMGNQTASPHKLMTLGVNIQGHKAKAVVDSGCTGNMMSPEFAKRVGIQRFRRAQKVYLYTFDGSPVKENGGMIEEETGKVGMKIGRHEERVKFDIVTTQGYDITLGLPWLTEHNPTIDYSDRSMRFDNCIHDGRRDAKVELEEISLKAMSMHYHRNPDSVVLAMVDLEETK
jgi:hypothetical protein